MTAAASQDPRKIDPALREKYDVRGPRYTSYPPATHFGEIDTNELFERWRARNGSAADAGLSLYLHVPYCRTRCLFCGCHTFIRSKADAVDDYVDALIREMELTAEIVDPSREVHQVAIGGGTPNFLSEQQSERLLEAMERIWKLTAGAERSVEIDPRTVTPDKLDVFIKRGFNRFSLGIQDFSESVLRVVRRGQDLMQVEEVLDYLRKNGIQSINFDLIYGLPGQDLDSMAVCARRVNELRPTRIALYSYAHVPWIHAHQKALERHGLPPQDLKASMFLAMMDQLIEAGYQHIGMDHFALPGDPLAEALRRRTLRRNFMGYTTGRGLDLLAFGASAISSIGSAYAQDHKQLRPSREALAGGALPVARGFLLSEDDRIRRELIIDLFCNFYTSLDELSSRFGIEATSYLAEDLERLKPLRDDGLVNWSNSAIEVTETGKFFIRNVCMTFDRYLEQDSGKRIYSRTV